MGALIVSLLVSIASVNAQAALNAQTLWIEPINLSGNNGRSTFPQVARDPASGDIHVVWNDDSPGNPEIYYRRWKNAAQTWTPPINLSASPWRDEAPDFWISSDGKANLVWTRRYAASEGAASDGTDILHRVWDGTSWSIEEVIFHNEYFLPSSYGLLLTEIRGELYLFIVFNRGFTYTHWDGTNWAPLAEWDYNLGIAFASIVADDEGRLHAAGFGENSGTQPYDQYFHDAYYSAFDGNSWSPAVNLSSTDGAAQDASLAIDMDGNVHFVWSDIGSPCSSESAKSAVYERVLMGTTWNANAEIITPNDGQSIQDVEMVADENGWLHLAWAEGVMIQNGATNIDVYYQCNDGAGWSSEEVIYISPVDSMNVDLGVGNNNVYVVWEEGVSDAEDIFFSTTDPSIKATPIYKAFLPFVVIGH